MGRPPAARSAFRIVHPRRFRRFTAWQTPTSTSPRMADKLSIEYRPLTELLALRWVENPKDHDLGLIHLSMDEHGFNDPVTLGRVGKKEMLVEGHGRLAVLEQKQAKGDNPPTRIIANGKGWMVPVNVGVSFPTMQKAKKYALQHNRLTEMGGYLDDKLLEALKEQKDDLEGIGWSGDDLDRLMTQMDQPLNFDLGTVPPSVAKNIQQIQDMRAQRNKGVESVTSKTDTERFLVIVFDTREEKAALLRSLDLPGDERYVLAKGLKITRLGAMKLHSTKQKSAVLRKAGATG